MQTTHEKVRIGTRGSPLALAQAEETRARLAEIHQRPETDFQIVVIKTMGDAILDRPLSEVGGKGLFTKEIEQALIDGDIDLAVHSMKDVPTFLPDGLMISTLLPRAPVTDALIGDGVRDLSDLPQGATVGSSSLRRRAQLLAMRPDLNLVEFRGNVQTRLRKLKDGVAAATLLARAGLGRLGMDDLGHDIPIGRMLPAVAQGAIGIEIRNDDAATRDLLEPIHHVTTAVELAAERAFLRILDGSCRTPIAGLGRLSGQTLAFSGEVLSPDGKRRLTIEVSGPADNAVTMGEDAAQSLLDQGAADLLGTV